MYILYGARAEAAHALAHHRQHRQGKARQDQSGPPPLFQKYHNVTPPHMFVVRGSFTSQVCSFTHMPYIFANGSQHPNAPALYSCLCISIKTSLNFCVCLLPRVLFHICTGSHTRCLALCTFNYFLIEINTHPPHNIVNCVATSVRNSISTSRRFTPYDLHGKKNY